MRDRAAEVEEGSAALILYSAVQGSPVKGRLTVGSWEMYSESTRWAFGERGNY